MKQMKKERTILYLRSGAVYTRGHRLQLLRKISPQRKQEILERWYDPHHRRFTEMVQGKLEKYGRYQIVDCHSFSPQPLPYEPEQDPDQPDICIGTDPFHTPAELAQQIGAAFEKLGYSVYHNRPYGGTIVPLAYYRKEENVRSFMVEVNRKLYMTENGEKTEVSLR